MATVKVYVLPGGNIQIMIDEASWEEAQEQTVKIVAQLAARGLAVTLDGPIEQHRDGGASHVHITGSVTHGH